MYSAEEFNEFYNLFSNYNNDLFKHICTIDRNIRKQILDVACGTGLSTSAIQINYPLSHIDAFDLDKSLIDYAIKLEELKDINFFVHDAKIPNALNGSWDLIVVKSSLHLFFDHSILKGYLNLLNEKGVLCLLETTHTSIDSYPILNNAKNIWKKNIPTERKAELVKEFRNIDGFDFTSSSFGYDVKISSRVLNNAVKNKQISCLWEIADEQIREWMTRPYSKADFVDVFAEFDVFFLKKQ
jgi:trans-aconitate methyltransferase